MKKTPFVSKTCKYDYPNKCDCSEDDNCGCTYPNNLNHDYSKDCFEDDILFCVEEEFDKDLNFIPPLSKHQSSKHHPHNIEQL